MTTQHFDSPLDDALNEFRLSLDAESDQKLFRKHLVIGLKKLVEHTRELEARLAALENQ